MNNSFILETPLTLEEKKISTSEREAELVKIIGAIDEVSKLVEWSTLKSIIFDSRVKSLEKQLENESLKLKIDDSELYRLQGRLFEARKYDLDKLRNAYRLELINIRKLNPPTER